jgi:hypothetical protein
MPDAMDYSRSLLPRERTYRLRAARVIGRVGRDRALGFSGSFSSCQCRHHIASRLQKDAGAKAGRQREFSHPVGTSVSREPRVMRLAVERQNRILLDLPLDACTEAWPCRVWSKVSNNISSTSGESGATRSSRHPGAYRS